MKIQIRYGNLYSEVLNREVYDLLDNSLSFRDKNYFWLQRNNPTAWDGYTRFFNKFTGKFLTGLIYRVKNILSEIGHTVEIIGDIPPRIEFKNLPLNGIEALRDDQIPSIKACLAFGRGIDSATTNFGKGEVIASLCKEYNLKTLVIVNRKSLFDNIHDRLKLRLCRPIGSIRGTEFKVANVTVAMSMTLSSNILDSNLLEYLRSIDLLIVDECHFAGSKSYQKVLKKIPSKYRFGFSATPFKDDIINDLKIEGIFGKIIHTIKNKTLIGLGISAKPEIRILNVNSGIDAMALKEDEEGNSVLKRNFLKTYKTCVVQNASRNLLINKICALEKKNILIIVREIEHGERLNNIIKGSVFINGTTKNNKAIVKDFDDEKIPVLISSSIIDTGVDISNIRVLILASGMYSKGNLLQRIGRGLRRKEFDNTVRIYDFKDNYSKYLNRHYKIRLKHYKEEQFTIVDNFNLEKL